MVNAKIISKHFWPPFQVEAMVLSAPRNLWVQGEQIVLHKRIADKVKQFSEEYKVRKNPRQLVSKQF
jgi:hypothetical protein